METAGHSRRTRGQARETHIDVLGDLGDKKKKIKKSDKQPSPCKQSIPEAAQEKEAAAGPDTHDSCGDCHKKVQPNHRAIKCDHCWLWHHTSCEKVSEEVYVFFSQHEDEESLHWFCKKCSILFKRIGSTVQRLEEAHRRLEEKVDSIADRLNNTTPTEVQEQITTVLSDKIREDKEEMEEQSRRKTSIIVHGLEESSAEEPSERLEDDSCQVATLLNELKCDNVNVDKLVRLGRKPEDTNSKPRPLKLVLQNEDQKTKLLKEAKNLKEKKEGGWDKVFMHQDLTPKQRELRKVAVAELKDRMARGERNLIIVNNKVITKRY